LRSACTGFKAANVAADAARNQANIAESGPMNVSNELSLGSGEAVASKDVFFSSGTRPGSSLPVEAIDVSGHS
jgi:hypothetical protein